MAAIDQLARLVAVLESSAVMSLADSGLSTYPGSDDIRRCPGDLAAAREGVLGQRRRGGRGDRHALLPRLRGHGDVRSSAALREVAKTVPPDRLRVETDSPFLSPEPLRGTRNEPANVVHTARCLALARGEPLEALAAATTANARRMFRVRAP